MPLNIPESDKASLTLATVRALPGATIYKDDAFWIGRDWTTKLLPALDEKFEKALRKHLDDGGLESFVQHYIEVKKRTLSSEDQAIFLEGKFADPLGLATEIIEAIEALPYKYDVAVRASSSLSQAYSEFAGRVSLSDRLMLVSADQVKSEIPLIHENDELDRWIWRRSDGDGTKSNADDDSIYFMYKSAGSITDRYDAKIFREFSDEIRAFYGACFAFDLLFDFGSITSGEVTPRIVAVRTDGWKSLSNMQPVDSDLVRATYVDTSFSLDKKAETDKSDLDGAMAPIKAMFASSDAVRLKTAASWLLRANLSAREIDRVLESTIALEVLLGDREASDRVGLSKLMANRCAYSLGKNASERRDLDQFFTNFYRVRSDIVHSGRFKVSDADRLVVREGLSLAHRVLRHEIKINSGAGL